MLYLVMRTGILKFVSDIRLDYEADARVPVYDDCDKVRKKSLDFLSKFSIKVSEWLRLIGNVNSKSWKDFLTYRGERAGAANRSYYAAYVFLEKVRIALNEEKSNSRILAELEFGEAGRPLKHDQSGSKSSRHQMQQLHQHHHQMIGDQ